MRNFPWEFDTTMRLGDGKKIKDREHGKDYGKDKDRDRYKEAGRDQRGSG